MKNIYGQAGRGLALSGLGITIWARHLGAVCSVWYGGPYNHQDAV